MTEPLAADPDAAVDDQAWLTAGVGGIGLASLLSDLGHEVPTSLLPSFLTSTLRAPASALGVIEGIADELAGAARLGGGALADDPARRRSVAVGGYATTAVLSSLIGVAGAAWQVGVLRAGAWTARGLRVPARNALLADVVSPAGYGLAYGSERAMDNLGAIGGPLLALALVALIGVRGGILVSVVPGLLAALAIVYAIRHPRSPTVREHRPIRLQVRPLLRGALGGLLVAATAFTLACTSPAKQAPTVEEVLRFEALPVGSSATRAAFVRWIDGTECQPWPGMTIYADIRIIHLKSPLCVNDAAVLAIAVIDMQMTAISWVGGGVGG